MVSMVSQNSAILERENSKAFEALGLLSTDAINELKIWETHRQLTFDQWGTLVETLHQTCFEVAQKGHRINRTLATFLQRRLEIDRAYAKMLSKPIPEFSEPGVDLDIVKILVDAQQKMGTQMDNWCGVIEKDLSRITSDDGLMGQFKKTSEMRLDQALDKRKQVREIHSSACEDWISHQRRYGERLHGGIESENDACKVDLWETESIYRRQVNRVQQTQEEATKALEDALKEVNALDRWRNETTTKFVNGFGHKQHIAFTELQSITNVGLRNLSQWNHNFNDGKTKELNGIEKASIKPETGSSQLEELRKLSEYSRLPVSSKFERFSGKLWRPPRNLLNPLAKWKETAVVITAFGFLHGWAVDEPQSRELAVSVNCNAATISKIKGDCFEIEESEEQSWGVVFSAKKKITLKAKTKEERNQWMSALQHFQQEPVTVESQKPIPDGKENKKEEVTRDSKISSKEVTRDSKLSSNDSNNPFKPPPPPGRPHRPPPPPPKISELRSEDQVNSPRDKDVINLDKVVDLKSENDNKESIHSTGKGKKKTPSSPSRSVHSLDGPLTKKSVPQSPSKSQQDGREFPDKKLSVNSEGKKSIPPSPSKSIQSHDGREFPDKKLSVNSEGSNKKSKKNQKNGQFEPERRNSQGSGSSRGRGKIKSNPESPAVKHHQCKM